MVSNFRAPIKDPPLTTPRKEAARRAISLVDIFDNQEFILGGKNVYLLTEFEKNFGKY